MKILVLGDVMVDEYVYVGSSRKAPEANIPVWDEDRKETRLGGAANVAMNVKAIGGPDVEVELVGLLGARENEAWKILKENGIGTKYLVNGPTMRKRRYVCGGEIVFRHDSFKSFPSDEVAFLQSIFCLSNASERFDVAIVSDYGKGTVTEQICEFLRGFRLTVVDSKRADIRRFAGMDVLKINEHERDAQLCSQFYTNYTELFQYCVVTKGAAGAELLQCEKVKSNDRRYIVHSEQFATEKVTVRDVTGCGDTFTAALACYLSNSLDIRGAIRFANRCATEVVQKFGTSTTSVV